MNPRTFLQKYNCVKLNKKINHIRGNSDLSGSGDTTLADLVVGQDGLIGHLYSPHSPPETHDIFNCRYKHIL